MRLLILGGTGLIGKHLSSYLVFRGHEPVALIRHESKKHSLPQGNLVYEAQENIDYLIGDPLRSGDWQGEIREVQGIVNLVGKNIMTRWTKSEKEEILNTRVESTRRVVEAIDNLPPDLEKPFLINTSALGYYPLDPEKVLTEEDPPGEHFLARVCRTWEQEAQKAEDSGARVARTRFAPVLSPQGGVLGNILPIFKKGLGGKLGTGKQPFPWIHIQDLVRAIEFIAEREEISGPVNLCSPQIIDNRAFTRELASALRKPAILPVSKTVLRILYGELSQTLLQGPKVKPALLQNQGFEFLFPRIDFALQDIVQKMNL